MIDGDNHEEECASLETNDIPQETPPGFGTTSLFKHYQKACKRHPRGLDIRRSLIKASKKVSGAEELTTHTFSQEYTRSELARMVILHDYPLSIVEHVGFRRYSASLQPSFTMISRNTLKNDIFSIYNDEKIKFYKSLDELKCRVAITTDMWTASNNKKGFMAITAHFIDDSWRLQTPHTADVLCDLLADALMDWNIDRKVSTITVDNCTTNDAMLRRLLDRLSMKDMLLDGKVLHMRCCAHILNLIVKDGLETISNTIERIRDSVVYWTASPARVERFEEVARQLNVSCGKKLSLDCKTRWNSTYLMLETAIAYKDVFPRAKAREIHYRSLPIDEDWENAVEICSKLKLFYNVTEMFSGIASVCESEHLDMFDQFVASSSSFCTKVSLTSELDFYLEESVLPRISKFDVLSWWKTNGVKYPNLQKMAKDILAIPVSTVASESAFSTSGRLVSPHRNWLHPSTLEALMCARRWLWNEGNGTCSKFSGLEACPTMLDEEEDEETGVETS
ncbi:hypothetical protein BUALT_Bualt07G0062000 [Buddleja alternifolia]|uniref:HAT C-terminal dimerisation domain-containing protein n=1 Tax=Buddleja alternifolia TaxID=168488 RepID=A0AAV6XJH5_9LAMI|nr:hypothetical protein BUALT_Bualt07G0062000 [Buddleja alternifolia]